MKRYQGFTLVEVIVALGIVSITLAAGMQATGALTRQAQRQTDMLLAQVCAENELIRLRAMRQQPDLGERKFECVQAGRSLTVHTHILATANPHFRRVDASVSDDGTRIWRVTTVLGEHR